MKVKRQSAGGKILPTNMLGELVVSKLNPVRQFSRVDFYQFIGEQKVELWWNSAERNVKLSAALNALVTALIERNVNQVSCQREQIRKYVIPWVLCGRNFLRLAFFEYAAFCKATGEQMMELSRIAVALGLPLDKDVDRKILEGKLKRSKIVGRVFAAFEDFRTKETRYHDLPVAHCAVCATMGAGKSTFINALLGRDVLPSRNEATTAKVTSVYDKDGDVEVMGFCETTKGVTPVQTNLTRSQLNARNDDPAVRRVFLRGDFDGIGNKGMVVAVHDTPGTNNSADASHHKITIDFLASQPLDLLVFVLNADQMGVADEDNLLKEVQAVVHKRHVPVLFVLNKADNLDPDKGESPSGVIERYRTQLEERGFDQPEILPVSARTARLVKMALSGCQAEMSAREARMLPGLVEDALLFPLVGDRRSQDAGESVDKLSAETLEKALKATGLQKAESRIEEILLSRKDV